MFLVILGCVFVVYDIVLLCISPGTFLDNLTSFTHIWTLMGAYMIFEGCYKKKKGVHFFETWKKWLQKLAGGCICFAVLVSVVNLCFIFTPKVADLDEPADYVVLLGGGIDKNGKLPKSVELRVKKAAEYLNVHKEAVCVVTGGTLKWLPYAEAPAIKNYLVKSGIEAERILVEDQALDTIQNFQLSCKMLADFKGVSEEEILNERMMIVTSHFHMRRAQRLAKRLGFADFSGRTSSIPLYSIPHTYLREICAYVKLNMRILLTGKPKKIQASL